MKKIFLLTILSVISITLSYSQEIYIETDKQQYKSGENILLTFKIEFQEDSIQLPEFKDFVIINGPSTSSSTSIINDNINREKTWKYILKPQKTGKLIIESPIVYLKNKKLENTFKQIEILENKLSKKELEEIRFNDFIENSFKPNGTLKYVLNDEFGYIEIFKDNKWQFLRKLTDKEFNKIKNIN